MSWNETTPGLYERPLGAAEKFMLSAIEVEQPPSREPIQIHTIADFMASHPSDKVTQAFKGAWKALRLLKSPDIATTFGNGYKYYKVPSSQELETWLDKSFTIAQTGTPVHTVIKDMQLCLEWLPVCYILPQPTQDGTFKGSIILFVSHWRTEAAGTFRIINQLFDYASDLLNGTSTKEALSNHTLGSEIHLLTPAVEDILMPNQQSTLESKARVMTYFENYRSNLPSIDFPIQGSLSATPSSVKLNQHIYTCASTSGLVSACNARGITVTSAVNSAYVEVMWHIAEPGKRNRSWACMMPAEVRKRLPISSPFREQGCWLAKQMLMLTAPPGQDFLQRAQYLRQQYGLANQETWLHKDIREVTEQLIDHLAKTPSDPIAMAWLSSMGVLDGDVLVPEHENMMVEKVTVFGDPTGPGIVLGLWTFKGRLNMQISWNVAYHGDGQIREVMDMIDKVLIRELGVEMEIEEMRILEC